MEKLSPKEKIKALGESITVEAKDPFTGLVRAISINPLEAGAPPFPGKGPVVDVCNSIREEISAEKNPTQERGMAKPVKGKGTLDVERPAVGRGSYGQ